MIYEGDRRLGQLFKARRERGSKELPMLSVTMSDGLVDRESLDRKMETNLTHEQHLLVKEGDIAYNMMRMWQGASGRADKDGLVSPAYVVLAPKADIDSLYASYLFKSHRLIYLFWAYSYGLTDDRLRLYFADFAKIPVSVPPVDQQRRIAKILSAWDRAIVATEKMIVNYTAQKSALMQLLLTGRKRLSGFNDKWNQFRLGQLFSERVESNCSELPLLSVTRREGVIARDDLGRRDTSSEDKSKYLRVCSGDIAYNTMRMWQGISALSSTEGLVSPAYTVITPKAGVSGRFMAQLFKSPRVIHDFYRFSQGLVSDTWNLKFCNFKEIRVTVPEYDEQECIADALAAADRSIQVYQNLRGNLVETKKGLMQQLVSGKRRVKVGNDA